MRPALMSLTLLIPLAACETQEPGSPPLRQVETAEDREFLRCLAHDPFLAGPDCFGFRQNGR